MMTLRATAFRVSVFLCLLVVASLTAVGCAPFERTVRQDDALYSNVQNQRVTPEMLEKTPLLSRNVERREYTPEGALIAFERTSESYGFPIAPEEQTFRASADLAETDTNLSQVADWTGTKVGVERQTAGNAETAAIAGQVQAQRTADSLNALESITDKLTATVVRTREIDANRDVEIQRIGAQKELEMAKLEPVHAVEEPAAPEPPDSPGGGGEPAP